MLGYSGKQQPRPPLSGEDGAVEQLNTDVTVSSSAYKVYVTFTEPQLVRLSAAMMAY